MGEGLSQCCCCDREAEWRPLPVEQGANGAPIPMVEDVWRYLFPQGRCTSSFPAVVNKKSSCGRNGQRDAKLLDLESSSEDEEAPVTTEANTSFSVEPAGKRGRSGSQMLKERMQNVDTGITVKELAKIPRLAASVKHLGDGKWRVHGIHVEKVLNYGLHRLDRALHREGILDFPCNEAGRPILLRESLFKDLLSGQRSLKTVPQTDAAAAQKDLPHLTLRQLLRLRVLNLDFAPGGNSVHATFLSMVDGLIFQRLGQKAAESSDPSEVASARKLGRDIVLLAAAAKSVPMPPCWVCWFDDRRIFLHMGRLACTDSAGIALSEGLRAGVLEFADKSEIDRKSPGHRLWLDLIVTLVTSETALSPPRIGSPGDSFFGSSGGQPQVSANELKNALGSLKRVQRPS